jgi:Lon protease-like protein
VGALRRIITTLGSREDGNVPMVEPYEWNSPSLVANRLCELLPVPLKAKQKLMELMDAGMRIEIVHRYMKQHHIL